MKIGINATSLNDRASGARQRFVGLYGALFRANSDVEYLIYEPRDCCVAGWFAGSDNVRGVATPLPSDARWGRFAGGIGYWRRQLKGDRLSVFETLHLPLLRAPGCPTVLTVHDARPVLRDVPAPKRALNRKILGRALNQADHVVTVSEAMKEELLALAPSARVTAIYNGVDPAPFRSSKSSPPAPLDGPFLLAVGHFERRKNYATLVTAMERLRHRYPDLQLAIVGKDGGTLADTAAQVAQLGLGTTIRLLHDVDDAGLASLYDKALMLVFPSTYEGFGIPILEAMAAGTPMALSHLPVFRELTQDGAAYFDPHDAASMANTIDALLSSAERQDEQRRYGEARIEDFSFPTLAAQLASLHNRLVATSGRSAGAL